MLQFHANLKKDTKLRINNLKNCNFI